MYQIIVRTALYNKGFTSIDPPVPVRSQEQGLVSESTWQRLSRLMEECTVQPLPRLDWRFLVALSGETFTNNTSGDCTSSVFWPFPLKWVPCGWRSTHSQLAPWNPQGIPQNVRKSETGVSLRWSEGSLRIIITVKGRHVFLTVTKEKKYLV